MRKPLPSSPIEVSKRGAELLHRAISAGAVVRPGRVAVCLDVVSAFARARRAKAIRAVKKHFPELLPLALAWLRKPRHRWAQGRQASELRTLTQYSAIQALRAYDGRPH